MAFTPSEFLVFLGSNTKGDLENFNCLDIGKKIIQEKLDKSVEFLNCLDELLKSGHTGAEIINKCCELCIEKIFYFFSFYENKLLQYSYMALILDREDRKVETYDVVNGQIALVREGLYFSIKRCMLSYILSNVNQDIANVIIVE